jgi:RND family efflux transporter MFP subunit
VNRAASHLNLFQRIAVMVALAGGAAIAQAGEYPAVLDWSGKVTLTLPVSGVLENVAAQPGQMVMQGELLASLEPALFKIGVAEARADLDRFGEEQVDARRDLERVRELYARTVASTTELDAARLRFARAEAGLAAAQARVERARRLLADSELRAPFDAQVLIRHGEPGLVITSQCQPAAVFTVARANQFVARAQIPATQAGALKPGLAAEVIAAGVSLTGKVNAISVGDDHVHQIEIVLPRQAGMAVGQQVNIRLP